MRARVRAALHYGQKFGNNLDFDTFLKVSFGHKG